MVDVIYALIVLFPYFHHFFSGVDELTVISSDGSCWRFHIGVVVTVAEPMQLRPEYLVGLMLVVGVFYGSPVLSLHPLYDLSCDLIGFLVDGTELLLLPLGPFRVGKESLSFSIEFAILVVSKE